MSSDRAQPTDDDHRVVRFRPRGGAPGAGAQGWLWPKRNAPPHGPMVEGLAKYEGGELDDYRHRMMVNLAALVFTIMLSIAGVWLAIQIAEMRKSQDCVLSGRRNCAPIDVRALEGR